MSESGRLSLDRQTTQIDQRTAIQETDSVDRRKVKMQTNRVRRQWIICATAFNALSPSKCSCCNRQRELRTQSTICHCTDKEKLHRKYFLWHFIFDDIYFFDFYCIDCYPNFDSISFIAPEKCASGGNFDIRRRKKEINCYKNVNDFQSNRILRGIRQRILVKNVLNWPVFWCKPQ